MDNEHEQPRQELLDLCSDWADAMVANDAERIVSYMADDWVIVSERGVSTKEQYMSFVESGALTHSSFEMKGDGPRQSLWRHGGADMPRR